MPKSKKEEKSPKKTSKKSKDTEEDGEEEVKGFAELLAERKEAIGNEIIALKDQLKWLKKVASAQKTEKKTKSPRKQNPRPLNATLKKFFKKDEMTRDDITRGISEYAKTNNLKKEGGVIKMDKKLAAALEFEEGDKKSLIGDITKKLSELLPKIEPAEKKKGGKKSKAGKKTKKPVEDDDDEEAEVSDT